ncbi:MAG: cell division protein FtsW [Alphaproteobacteria bacterium]|nr:cell division protein FtsW [Alphaproteobacteria bacterium]
MAQTIRTDKSVLGRWWWTVDRWTFMSIIVLVLFGILLVTAASPSVAERLDVRPFYFVYRHIVFLVPTLGLLLACSLMSRKTAWRVSSLTLVISIFLTGVAILMGAEVKGATRWVHFLGLSLQPSEFIKPAFAVTSAWLIARHQHEPDFPGHQLATGLFLVALTLLMMQPDLGMSFVLSSIWGVQVFLSGLPMLWVLLLFVTGVVGLFSAYMFLPHVTSRVDRFLDPASGDNYQVQKSLDAFRNGGLFGTGPGHGQVKLTLPDAHADFIFSVAGEELGLIATVFLILVFCFIVIRSVIRIMNSEDMFIVLGTAGLVTQFALQSLIHMGSCLQLIPAKGMTLPFISYGGSSLLSLGMGMGMLLALTRKRSQASSPPQWNSWYEFLNAGEGGTDDDND